MGATVLPFCDVKDEFLNDTANQILSYKDDPELENLRVFEQKSYETMISLKSLEEYRGIKKGQLFQIKYKQICKSGKDKTINGLGLKSSETVVSGIENWLSRFYKRCAGYVWDIHEETINLKVSFILEDRGQTKVYFEFAR